VSNRRFDPEILFGRIALMLDYISAAQLTECVMAQEQTSPRKKLGEIMLETGYLTGEQVEEVLRVQEVNLQSPTGHPERRLEDTIMGRLIVKNNFATGEQVNEALRTQALREQEGGFYRLGEIMVEKGYMNVRQVLEVLKVQGRQIMICPGCGARFNVDRFQTGRKYRCKKCKSLLSVPASLESVGVDTTIFVPKPVGSDSDTIYPEQVQDSKHPGEEQGQE